ncbi:MAG: hypothetical protein GY754_43225 [bacterium]|nr:hypothetical protein [bacterium]
MDKNAIAVANLLFASKVLYLMEKGSEKPRISTSVWDPYSANDLVDEFCLGLDREEEARFKNTAQSFIEAVKG